MLKNKQKLQRKKRVRGKIVGTAEKPRLSVFRSNTHIYAQLIDDIAGKTIYGVSDYSLSDKVTKEKKANKIDIAKELGMNIAKEAETKKITKVIFDRGHYKYHGRVKALAEGAREGGLQF